MDMGFIFTVHVFGSRKHGSTFVPTQFLQLHQVVQGGDLRPLAARAMQVLPHDSHGV